MPPENDGASPPAPDAAATPQYATVDQIGNMVNSAITAHLKRSLGKSIEESLKPYLEKLQAAPPAPPAPPTVDPKDAMQRSPEFASLQKQIEDLKKANEQAEQGRKAAEMRQREDKAFADLKGSLAGQVKPEFLDMVASHLFQVQKAVDWEEDGTAVLKIKRQGAFGEEDVRLPIKDGVDQYLKSDAAKPFLPPPGSSGASPKPRGNVAAINPQFDPTSASDEDKVRHAIAMEARLRAQGLDF